MQPFACTEQISRWPVTRIAFRQADDKPERLLLQPCLHDPSFRKHAGELARKAWTAPDRQA
jgi:hypothetical protein